MASLPTTADDVAPVGAEQRLWLDDPSRISLPTAALATLRRELISLVGAQSARGLLTRMGYAAGSKDAVQARKVRQLESVFNSASVNPARHSLEGLVSIEPIRVEIDPERGHYFGEFIWSDSSEAEDHLEAQGESNEPVCWMQIGYASGYSSVFMGRRILYREVECRGMGHAVCRAVGRPLEDWPDPEPDLRYFQPEDFANRFVPPDAMTARLSALAEASRAASLGAELVGASAAFNSACHQLRTVAASSATVLFLGETGVGKEMFARTLHRISPRASQPFVAVNCAAIPDTLIEAELFGVEKGAFTGATQSRPGRFERANGGTLFLDEVGILNLSAQGKLLRALQEREIERVGDSEVRKVDVRVIAATNVPLEEAVREGRFRLDLYYRLNVFPIRIPPLRERRDDIPLLMDHMVARLTASYGKHVTGFTSRSIEALLRYDYPGNIRELENMLERAVILVPDGAPLDIDHLSFSNLLASPSTVPRGAADAPAETAVSEPSVIDVMAKEIFEGRRPVEDLLSAVAHEAVKRAGGNLAEAARILGVTRAQLAYRLKRKWQRTGPA